MIKVTRLNGVELHVNDDHIELIEVVPETILSLSDGKKITVKEEASLILERIIEFRQLASLPAVKKD